MDLDGTILEAEPAVLGRLRLHEGADRRQAVLGRSVVDLLGGAGASGSRRRPPRQRAARRSAPRCPTSSPTAASGWRTSPSCPSRTRRAGSCSWPRPASTSPTASGPRPTGRSSSRWSRTAPTSSACAIWRASRSSSTAPGWRWSGWTTSSRPAAPPVRDFFFPEDQPRIMDEFFPSVLEKGHGEIEVRFRHFKTGEARWMAYKVLTLTDAAGRPVAFATVSQDVTERRRLEDDLRTGGDLSEADRRKNEFLAMLAHELRNPLAPIRNAVRALRVGHGDAKVAHAALGMIERQVGQLVRLVDDLLDVSRITRGKIELRKEPVELRADRRAGRRGGARAVRQPRPRADGHAADAAGLPERRPDPAGAGVRQPAEQRVQVHRPGRSHRADGRARGRAGGRSRAGHRHRHRGRTAAPPLQDVHAGGHVAGALARRAGHRPDAGEGGWSRCTAARSRRAARGSARERVRRAPAGAGGRFERRSRRLPRRADDDGWAAAS